jgi:predicted PurR-regulated permease PerM
MNKFEPSAKSPYWGTTTKTVVGLGVVLHWAPCCTFYTPSLVPLLLAFVLSYLLYPVVEWFQRVTRFSWRASAGIV